MFMVAFDSAHGVVHRVLKTQAGPDADKTLLILCRRPPARGGRNRDADRVKPA